MLSWVCSTIIVLDPRFVCSSLTSNRGQQFVVRSEKFRGFQLFRSTSAFTWKKVNMCAWITQKTGVLHFKHKMWLKDWFQDFTSRILIGHTWEPSNRTKKKAWRELNYLKLPCPKFKRERQTAHVTAGVWTRDSETNEARKLPNKSQKTSKWV